MIMARFLVMIIINLQENETPKNIEEEEKKE